MSLFSGAWVVLMYVVTAIALAISVVTGTMWGAGIAFILLTLWDVGWLLANEAVRDRAPKDMNEAAGRARQYIYYFMAAYGIGFGFVLHAQAEDRAKLLQLCTDAGVPKWLFLVPFAVTGVALLFIPIKLTKGPDSESTKCSLAVESLVAFIAWCQQATILALLYAIGRVLYYAGTT